MCKVCPNTLEKQGNCNKTVAKGNKTFDYIIKFVLCYNDYIYVFT